jgi:hypothetical protein
LSGARPPTAVDLLPARPLDSRVVSVGFADAAGAETRVAVHALVGTLRDARSVCPGVGLTPPNGDIFSTEPIVVDVPPAALRAAGGGAGGAAARPRAILVDAGATGWGAVTDARYPNTVGMPWLVEAYAARGVAFDDIFAFEATQLPAARFFAGMPARVAASGDSCGGSTPSAAGGASAADEAGEAGDRAAGLAPSPIALSMMGKLRWRVTLSVRAPDDG